MPCLLEPIPTPPDAPSDDPAGILRRAALAHEALVRTAHDPLSEPDDEREALEEALAWTSVDEAKHPRWPEGTPGGLGGKFMRVGQMFEYGGKLWEVGNIVAGPDGQGQVVAIEAGGKTASEKILDPRDFAGPEQELTGITRPAAKVIRGGKGQDSTVTAVNPHVDPSTHDPAIQPHPDSELTPEEWQAFGRAEQLHYNDLMARYGKYGNVSAATLIKKAYQGFDSEIQDIVSGGYASQYGSSSGHSLSLLKVFNMGHKTEVARDKREKAMELQGLVRDAYAWDLYNRTKAPDLTIIHKSGYLSPAKPTSWWTSKFIKGKERIFSGLSCSFSSEAIGKPQIGLATAVSLRHVVMATYVSGPKKNAAASFQGELEVAVPYQLLVDETQAMSYHINEVPSGYRQWLGKMTKVPRGGEVFRMFREAVLGNGDLPVPPVAAEIKMHGGSTTPPPPEAIKALEEFGDQLPTPNKSYTPAQLAATGLPFDNLDKDGHPTALEAAESHAGAGDFVMGLKGTLYYVNADPSAQPSGLRLHMIVPDGSGGLKFNGETYIFSEGHPNYKLLGNVPPTKVDDVEFTAEAWLNDTNEPQKVATLKVGDKFKVNGTPYEVKAAPGPGQTEIQDLNSGLTGTINSDYKATLLVPNPEFGGGKLKPEKGMTLAYNGEKHVVTSIKANGVVSIKPAKPGTKVVQIDPEDPALKGLFDPKAWRIGPSTAASTLEAGDLFHGGRGKRIRPYRVDDSDGSWVYWTNLDTGETGKFLKSKQVRPLLDPDVEPEAVPPQGVTEGVTADTSKVGDTVHKDMLNVGDEFIQDGKTYHVVSVVEGDAGTKTTTVLAYYPDGKNLNASDGLSVEGPVTLTAKGKKQPPTVHPATPNAMDHVLDGTPHVGDLYTPYKSSHGPGGAYKHERLEDLPEGTVLRDKSGKKWKIQVAGTEPIITDGFANYKADGKARGRVLEDTELSSPPPPNTDPAPAPEDTPGVQAMHHGYAVGEEVTMAKNSGGTWTATVVGSTKTPSGKDALEVQKGTKTYTVPLEKVTTPPPAEGESAKTGLEATPLDHTLDGLPSADDLYQPYKSSHGTGGKIKHDRIKEMPAGTVFQDKTGKKWKVQIAGGQPVISDGVGNYTIDGHLRGKALPGETLSTPPAPEGGTAPGAPAAPEGTVAVSALKVGDIVRAPGSDLQFQVVGMSDNDLPMVVIAGESAPGIEMKPGAGPFYVVGTAGQEPEKPWPEDFVENTGDYKVGDLAIGISWPTADGGVMTKMTSATGKKEHPEADETEIIPLDPGYVPAAYKHSTETPPIPVPTPEQKAYFAQLKNLDTVELVDGKLGVVTDISHVGPGNEITGIKVELAGENVPTVVWAADIEVPSGWDEPGPELEPQDMDMAALDGKMTTNTDLVPTAELPEGSYFKSSPTGTSIFQVQDGQAVNVESGSSQPIAGNTALPVIPGEVYIPDAEEPTYDVSAFAAWGGFPPTKAQAASIMGEPMGGYPEKFADEVPLGALMAYHAPGGKIGEHTKVWIKVSGNQQMAIEGGEITQLGMQPLQAVALPPNTDPATPAETVADLKPQDKLPNGMTVVAITSNGGAVLKNPDGSVHKNEQGQIATYPSDVSISDITPNTPEPPTPEVSPPHAMDYLAELDPGDEFENMDGHPFSVVAATSDMQVIVKDGQSGELQKLDEQTMLGEVDPISPQPVAAASPDYEGAPTYTSGALPPGFAAQVEPGAIDLDLPGYGSAWGSGGKYKHDYLTDMIPGQQFTAKGGKKAYTLVASVAGGKVLIWDPAQGKAFKVPNVRVKKHT